MNNNFFSLVRYLRDRGLETDLLLRNNEFDHFMPNADSFTEDYKSYTHKLSWGHVSTWYTTPKSKIESDLTKYDFTIGCGTVPAFMEKIKRQLDLFIPYGADLYGFPFMKFPWYIPFLYQFSRAQAKGIKSSKHICLDYANDLFEKPIKKLAPVGKRHYLAIPMLYLPEYSSENIRHFSKQYPFSKKFQTIRNNHFPIIFHQTRHNWKTSPDIFTWKGNDQLVKGFASFVKSSETKYNPALILFEYGADVKATKQLIIDLNIEKNVYWFPKMSRKELMIGLSHADIGASEFANSWLFCGTVIESLAMEKPLLHYREDNLYTDHYPKLYPLMNAKTDYDISQHLNNYVNNPSTYKNMGKEGKKWLEKFFIDKPLKQIIKIISCK